jgi:murein DD-endopeptidase MepM/ murein hydrolase activator NlpD
MYRLTPFFRALTLSAFLVTTLAAQTNLPILNFPLKANLPNQDQHLTAATAKTNSVFDHSMYDSGTHRYAIYACDQAVTAFTGTNAIYGPGLPIFGQGCNAGYKVQNLQNPPPITLFGLTYTGWGTPNHLFYDGHPGLDYQAAMDTQVYAAVSGTVHYPAQMVGLGYPAAAYHALEVVPDHAAGTQPAFLFYYLHLDTYIGQQ